MNAASKKVVTAGIAIITASAVATAPCITSPESPRHLAVQLSAQVTSTVAQPFDPMSLVIDWLERVVIPPSASAPFPTPDFLPIVAPTSIGSTIKNVYNAVEPWVRYGFDLAAYAVGWIPYVGWLAPQITIFYNFGERIARSITYNIADFLDGHISFVQGLINVSNDTIASLVQLGRDQLAFWLPPLPPLPPFPFAATGTQLSTLEAPVTNGPAVSPATKLVARGTSAPSAVTPTSVVITNSSDSPGANPADATNTQVTQRATGPADTRVYRDIKGVDTRATTGTAGDARQPGSSGHVDDNTSTGAMSTADSSRRALAATETRDRVVAGTSHPNRTKR